MAGQPLGRAEQGCPSAHRESGGAVAWWPATRTTTTTTVFKSSLNTQELTDVLIHSSLVLQESGDLGLVACNSRGKQKTLFQPKPLTLRGVRRAVAE